MQHDPVVLAVQVAVGGQCLVRQEISGNFIEAGSTFLTDPTRNIQTPGMGVLKFDSLINRK